MQTNVSICKLMPQFNVVSGETGCSTDNGIDSTCYTFFPPVKLPKINWQLFHKYPLSKAACMYAIMSIKYYVLCIKYKCHVHWNE